MADPVLVGRGLSKLYRMGELDVPALRGVDVALGPGELVVILGASGSGKSTLLNILGGLDHPTEGEVSFRGTRLSRDDERALTAYRRDHVGFVFQFYNLIPSLTALENVELAAELVHRPRAAAEALALVQLEDFRNHFPSQLSGGQQQRVAIARAIAKRPSLLLCDEPTGALDGETGRKVLAVLERLNRETGTTTAIITHNAVVGGLADRVLTMVDGRIATETRNPSRRPAEELRW